MTTIAARCSQNDADLKAFFNRPDFEQCILLEDTRVMACDGQLVQTKAGQVIMRNFDQEDILENYYKDKEERLFFCLKFGRRRCR